MERYHLVRGILNKQKKKKKKNISLKASEAFLFIKPCSLGRYEILPH